MGHVKPVDDVKKLRQELAKITTSTAGDVRFIAQAALFTAEQVAELNTNLAEMIRLLRPQPQPRRKPSAWNLFFAEGMKAGKAPALIAHEWRGRKGSGA